MADENIAARKQLMALATDTDLTRSTLVGGQSLGPSIELKRSISISNSMSIHEWARRPLSVPQASLQEPYRCLAAA